MSSQPGPPPPLGAEVEAGVARNGDVHIAWRTHGRGQPVLMIMGFLGTGHAWFRLLPHLAATRQAIVFDNRGTGDSDRAPGLWSMEALAGDAVAVLDAIGVEAAHVVGASMGGMIAQQLALDHPTRVRSLTLACTHPGRLGGRPRPLPWRLAAAIALRPVLGTRRTFPLVAPLLYSDRTLEHGRDRLRHDLELRVRDATPLLTAVGQLAAIAG
nr:alpha/beta hydrolase [Actinomycetota bacterium]